MSKIDLPSLTRRKVVALGGAAAAVAPYHFVRRASAQGTKRVIVSGWGGATQQAMRDAYFTPFTKATGIEVVEQTYGGQGLARLKAQLAEGGAQVDVLDGAPFWAVVGSKQNLLDKIALPGLSSASFMPGALADYAFGYATVSWGITYNKQSGAAPRNWRDFWDTKTFKGRRTFFGPFIARHPEYALMADGVPSKDVYPLTEAKIDQAFAKLQQLKPAINVWYQTGVQCEQLLLDKQVDMAEFFNGRAFYLQDQGVPIEYVWNEAVMNILSFVLAKDAPNRDNGLQFLSFVAQPEQQAAFAKMIYYGPTNTKAFDLIADQKTVERLPTFPPNLAQQVVLDGDWWGENLDRLGPRWSQLISG